MIRSAKRGRPVKRQRGQFMTPTALAERLVGELVLEPGMRVLEPSFGKGSFLLPLIERLVAVRRGSARARFERVMTECLYGFELDRDFYAEAVAAIEARWGPLP